MRNLVATVGRLAVVNALLTGFLLASGCSQQNRPTTYPVTGTVLWQDGQPVRGGMVEFRPSAVPNVTTLGQLQPDGSFSLHSIFGNQKVPGATEGEHQVTVFPPSSGHERTSFLLPQKYTVKADQENHFVIKLDSTAPKG